jgi:predicted RNA-binding Zn ribbon-like protein
VFQQTNPEAMLLPVINSTPVLNGVVIDQLSDPVSAAVIVQLLGGKNTGTQTEILRSARDTLQEVVRGRTPAAALDVYLAHVVSRPSLRQDVVGWTLEGPESELPAARLVLAWSQITGELPGRLRPCANPECTRFLIDHSKPNAARWCSMAACGNRLKARRYQARRAALSG